MNQIIAKLLSKPEPFTANGHSRRDGGRSQAPRRLSYVTTSAELAPCACPDFCERDHEND